VEIKLSLRSSIYDGYSISGIKTGREKFLRSAHSDGDLIVSLNQVSARVLHNPCVLMLREAIRIFPLFFFTEKCEPEDRKPKENAALVLNGILSCWEFIYCKILGEEPIFDIEKIGSIYNEVLLLEQSIFQYSGELTLKKDSPPSHFYPVFILKFLLRSIICVYGEKASCEDVVRNIFYSYHRAIAQEDSLSHYEINEDIKFLLSDDDPLGLLLLPAWRHTKNYPVVFDTCLSKLKLSLNEDHKIQVDLFSGFLDGVFLFQELSVIGLSGESNLLQKLTEIQNKEFTKKTANGGTKMFNINIPVGNAELVEHILPQGELLYIVGSNGVGKSALLQKLFSDNRQRAKIIFAHRKVSIKSNFPELNTQSRQSAETQSLAFHSNADSRYLDNHLDQDVASVIFDIVRWENACARELRHAHMEGNTKLIEELGSKKSILEYVNELMGMSGLDINITIDKDEKIFANKPGVDPYPITSLSDGEKSILLLSANVLLAKENTLVIIDEPERHLHRSILLPFMEKLYSLKSDCSFVVSTHDLDLASSGNAKIISLLGCKWSGKSAIEWNAKLIESNADLDLDLKKNILGSRKNIMFVEGKERGTDEALYSILFPDYFVIAKGGCVEVDRAVRGISSTSSISWINAVGIIDRDDKTDAEVEHLKTKKIHAIPFSSVESIYYHEILQALVAEDYQSQTLMQEIGPIIIEELDKSHIKKAMCERMVEGRIRKTIAESVNGLSISFGDENLELPSINPKFMLQKEIEKFNSLSANPISLLYRYCPKVARSALNKIARHLGNADIEAYKTRVKVLLVRNSEAREKLRCALGLEI